MMNRAYPCDFFQAVFVGLAVQSGCVVVARRFVIVGFLSDG